MLPFLQRLEKSWVVVQLGGGGSADENEPILKELKVEWFENEDVENVISRLSAQLFQAADELPVSISSSRLQVEKVVNPSRSSDSLDHEVLMQLVSVLQSYHLREIVFKDNCEYIGTAAGVEGLATLRTLDLTACGLTEVPEVLACLENLQTLFVRRNKLGTLPVFLGRMHKLQHLDADDNLITILPGVTILRSVFIWHAAICTHEPLHVTCLMAKCAVLQTH